MDTMGNRLRLARQDAKFTSARAAAARHGWSPSTYAAHENGQNKFSAEIAAEYARAFGTSATWLLLGYPVPKSVSLVPVTALVLAPDNIQTLDPAMGNGKPGGFNNEPKWTYYYAECQMPVPKHARAFEVKGHGMWPRYDNGDLLISDSPMSSDFTNGRECLLLLKNGSNCLRVAVSKDGDIFDLQAHNAPPLAGVEVLYLWRVDTVLKSGTWNALTSDDPKWSETRDRVEREGLPRLRFE